MSPKEVPKILVRSHISHEGKSIFMDSVPTTVSPNEKLDTAAYVEVFGAKPRLLVNGNLIKELEHPLPERKLRCILDGLLKKELGHGKPREA